MFCFIFLLLLRFLPFEIDIADMDPLIFFVFVYVFDVLYGFYRLIIIM